MSLSDVKNKIPKPSLPNVKVPGFVKKHKKLFIIALLAVIVGFGYTKYRKAAEEALFSTDTVIRRDIRTEYFFSGTVEPLLSQEVMSAMTGVRVTEVLVKEGDEVHKGDVLFRLDAKAVKDQIKEKEASMAHSARANGISLQEAQAEYDNLASNIENGLDTTVQTALNGIDSSMAALAKAQENYNTEVYLNNNQMSEKLRTAINAVNGSYRRRDNAADARKAAERALQEAITAGKDVASARAALVNAENAEDDVKRDYQDAQDQFAQAKVLEASNLTQLYQALIDAQNNYLHAVDSYNIAVNAQTQKLENLSLKIAAAKESGDTTVDALQLEKLNNQLNDYEVKATIDGQITKLSVKPGDVTAVNATTSLGTITDYTTMKVAIKIGEFDITTVEPGMPVRIHIGALDKDYDGVIHKIDRNATVKDNYSYFNAEVTFDGDEDIKSGLSAQVSIASAESPDALSVVNDAVATETDGTSYVLIRRGGKDIHCPVDVGITDGTYTEIRKGLEEGDEVVYMPSASTVSDEENLENYYSEE